MSDDIIKIILNKLDKIDNKQDAQAAQLSEINSELAEIKEQRKQQDKINEKVEEHELKINQGVGTKNTLGWLFATLLSIIAIVSQHFHL